MPSPAEARRAAALRRALLDTTDDELRERIAKVLRLHVWDVKGMSLGALQELVWERDPALAREISEHLEFRRDTHEPRRHHRPVWASVMPIEDFVRSLRKLVPRKSLSMNGERQFASLVDNVDPLKRQEFLRKYRREDDLRTVLRGAEHYSLHGMNNVAPFLRTGRSLDAQERDPAMQRIGLTLTKKDKSVVTAFADQKAATGDNLSTDGTRLDGHWLGGSGIAKWVDGKVEFFDLGGTVEGQVERVVRKAVPRNQIRTAQLRRVAALLRQAKAALAGAHSWDGQAWTPWDGLAHTPWGTPRKLSDVEVALARDHIKGKRGRKSPGGRFQVAQRVTVEGQPWLVYDFDADHKVPEGYRVALVSPDFERIWQSVEPSLLDSERLAGRKQAREIASGGDLLRRERYRTATSFEQSVQETFGLGLEEARMLAHESNRDAILDEAYDFARDHRVPLRSRVVHDKILRHLDL